MPPAATGCTVGTNVTVPCEKKGWSFAADALYVETNNIGAVSANTTTSGTTGTTTNVGVNDFNNDWNWGFVLAAAYYFGTGNDINLNWTHFVHTADQTDTADEGYYIGDVLDDSEALDQVSTSVGNDFNSLNLEFGQLVHFGDHVDTRFHAGLQWAQVDESLEQTGLNTSDDSLSTDSASVTSDFDGIGPRLGMDSAYNFGNGLSLFGDLAASLLVGSVKTTSSETRTDEAGDVSAIINTSSSTGNMVVPEAEVKLGVRYTKPLAQGDLSAEVGYEAVNYWNVQNLAQYDDTGSDNESNFGYNGIFFGLKWMGNA
jgi:hypothetical protein